MSNDILDYVDLVTRYEAGLTENLRNFGIQTEYLDLWVPDEDLSRSLLNLFDAAAEVGHSSLAVRIPADSATLLKQAGFPDLAAKRGRFSTQPDNGSTILRITDLQIVKAPSPMAQAPLPSTLKVRAVRSDAQPDTDAELRQPQTLSEPYSTHLDVARKSMPIAPARPGLVQAHSEIDGLLLEAAIDPKEHVIYGMTATGTRGKVCRDLLLVLAYICQGLPILEAADHGAIRLEYLLRRDAPRPRAGIIIPETVDPAFRFVSVLLRALLADYRQKTGFRNSSNTFDTPPGPRWMQADDATRRLQLAEAFALCGFSTEDVTVVAIEYNVRVVVSLSATLAINGARTLTTLERHMKQHVDRRLELFLTELKDSNKLRRLSELKTKTS